METYFWVVCGPFHSLFGFLVTQRYLAAGSSAGGMDSLSSSNTFLGLFLICPGFSSSQTG